MRHRDPWRGTSPMACQDVVELLTAHLEDALPPRLADRVTQHLAGCDDCLTYLEQLRATVAGLAEIGSPTLPEQTCTHLVTAFRDWARTEADGA